MSFNPFLVELESEEQTLGEFITELKEAGRSFDTWYQWLARMILLLRVTADCPPTYEVDEDTDVCSETENLTTPSINKVTQLVVARIKNNIHALLLTKTQKVLKLDEAS